MRFQVTLRTEQGLWDKELGLVTHLWLRTRYHPTSDLVLGPVT
jgi:hypothetical protein